MIPLSGTFLEDIYGDNLQNEKQNQKQNQKPPESFKQNDTRVNKEIEYHTKLKHKISNKNEIMNEDQENTNSKRDLVDLNPSSIMNTVSENFTKFFGKMEPFTPNQIDINLIGEIIREIILLLKLIVILLLLLLINQISKR